MSILAVRRSETPPAAGGFVLATGCFFAGGDFRAADVEFVGVVAAVLVAGRVPDGDRVGVESGVDGDTAGTSCVLCQRWTIRNPSAAIARIPSTKRLFSARVSGTRPG